MNGIARNTESLTNVSGNLANEQSSLNFEPVINGRSISNYLNKGYYVIPLETNRTISILIPHLATGAKSIEKLTVDFISELDVTNYSTGIRPDWWQQMFGDFSFLGKKASALEIINDHFVNQITGWLITPLTNSTNYQNPAFAANINILAPGINGVKSYAVNFVLPFASK